MRLVVSAAVSLLVLALLMKLVVGAGNQDAHPGLWTMVTRISLPLMAGYLVCTLLQTWIRSQRYRVLLRAAGSVEVPARGHMMMVTMARNMFVDLLPARAGELAYIGLLNRGYRVAGEHCVSSLALSFVFDLAALAVLIASLILVQLVTATVPLWQWMALGFVALLAVVGIWGLLQGSGWADRVLDRWFGGRTGPRPVATVKAFIDRLAASFGAVARAGALGRVLGLSVGVRLFKYTGLYMAFLALTRDNFPELFGAGVATVLSALVAGEAAASLPLPTLMSFGTYEAGGTAVWALLGFPAASGAMAMLAIHVSSQIVDYSLGGLGLLLLTLIGAPAVANSGVEGSRRTPARPRRRYVVAATSLLLLGAGGAFAFWEYRALQKTGALVAPEAGRDVAPVGSIPDPEWAESLAGFVVWSSNRDGQHDIFRMDLPSRAITRVTDHPHTETYPRISPDGKRVVFTRSQIPWVSQRNKIPWDVILRDLTTGEETVVAINANVPYWINDEEIIYQRAAVEVVRHHLITGEREVLYAPGMGSIGEQVILETPTYNPESRQLAVNLRGRDRGSMLLDEAGERWVFGNGCQVNWSPDRSWLYYVDHLPGKDNAFFIVRPGDKEREVWFNHVKPFSHEYFPRLDRGGEYLVFGASEGGHEHDVEDYEIFIWRVGGAMDDTLRLTWHTGNDCWPDVWLR
jgi:uncharacterized membrane protein YbhN (UPF0104 family)